MKLNHIDLQVSNVEEAARFFERHFEFVGHPEKRSSEMAILEDGHGLVLVLQRKRDEREQYPDGFHVGFLVDDDARVLAFQRRARAEGLDVSDVEHDARGTRAYCHAPGGILVEVSRRA